MYRLCAGLLLAFAFVVVALGPVPAWAHDERVSTSEVTIDGALVVWRVDVGLEAIGKLIALPVEPPDLGEEDLAPLKDEIARALAPGLLLVADGAPLAAEVGKLEPRFEPAAASGRPSLARVVLELRYRASKPIDELVAQVRLFAELTSQHRALIKVRWGDEGKQFVRLGPSQLRLERGRLLPTESTLAWDFAKWGAHHIFVGYDHIAFLVALLLATVRFGELIKVVTSFTVAHSVTILLAALGLLTIPSRLTEILIAASIVYVAAENLLGARRSARHRWMVTFAFGLVHGLGFATELHGRLAELPGSVVLPVLSFNVGVELGQIAIVCLIFPLFAHIRRGDGPEARARRQRALLRWGSAPVLLLGLYWLLDRAAG